MDKKSKALVIVFVIIVIISAYLTYERSFIEQNFEIINEEETQ